MCRQLRGCSDQPTAALGLLFTNYKLGAEFYEWVYEVLGWGCVGKSVRRPVPMEVSMLVCRSCGLCQARAAPQASSW